MNIDFGSRVRFANYFHEWCSHEGKSLANRFTNDKKRYSGYAFHDYISYALFYALNHKPTEKNHRSLISSLSPRMGFSKLLLCRHPVCTAYRLRICLTIFIQAVVILILSWIYIHSTIHLLKDSYNNCCNFYEIIHYHYSGHHTRTAYRISPKTSQSKREIIHLNLTIILTWSALSISGTTSIWDMICQKTINENIHNRVCALPFGIS